MGLLKSSKHFSSLCFAVILKTATKDWLTDGGSLHSAR